MARPVAVITGAASGIGLAVTRRLARTHRVALLDIDGDAVRQAARDLAARAARGDLRHRCHPRRGRPAVRRPGAGHGTRCGRAAR
ncbi:SDR family NAD(P)-dependent oxidoreductase [Streptomyces sp. CoH27]|uniref:SDR family NAD(P)-dependent oxidoreductase n=1 Tax=Streptomyces sp. CoH27 TaxID=2875763 RepID=UPI0035A8AC87